MNHTREFSRVQYYQRVKLDIFRWKYKEDLYKGYCLKLSTIKSLWYVNSDQKLIDSERIEYLPSKIRWEIRKLMALSDLQIVSKVYSLKNNNTWTNNMIQIDTRIGFPQFGNKCMKIQFWHFYLSSMDSFRVLHTNR